MIMITRTFVYFCASLLKNRSNVCLILVYFNLQLKYTVMSYKVPSELLPREGRDSRVRMAEMEIMQQIVLRR